MVDLPSSLEVNSVVEVMAEVIDSPIMELQMMPTLYLNFVGMALELRPKGTGTHLPPMKMPTLSNKSMMTYFMRVITPMK